MKKAILIVSFGTTYTDTRTKNITAIKQQVSMLYPDTIVDYSPISRREKENLENRTSLVDFFHFFW